MTSPNVVWGDDTKKAMEEAERALEHLLRLQHRDRVAGHYFGDPTLWDEKETEASSIDNKVLSGWVVSSQFQDLSDDHTVNVLYATPFHQSPVVAKGLLGYAHEAYR